MYKSDLVIDINAMGGIAVRASYRPKTDIDDNGNLIAKTKSIKVKEEWYHEWKLYKMLAVTMNDLRAEGFSGRVTMIIPDRIFYRCIQMMKLIGNEGFNPTQLLIDWMCDKKFEFVDNEGKKFNQWLVSFIELSRAYEDLLATDVLVNWQNARQLYKWKLDGNVSGLANGNMLFFKGGVCEEKGIFCKENTFLNGQQEVTITVERYGGKEHRTYFVKRKITEDANGVPTTDSGIAVKNALLLRTENAKQFPRIKVAKNVTVVRATNGLF